MTALSALTERNLKQYFRDRGAVFFSLLSMLIVICLMLFFLGDMNVEAVTKLLAQFPNRDAAADAQNAQLLIMAWTCAGILSINAVTVTLAVYSVMVKDGTGGKLNSFYISPISRSAIAGSYILAAWTASVIICTLTLALTEGCCVSKGMAAFSFAAHVKLFGMIMVNSFSYAAIMYVVALLAKTDGAWSGFGTIIGTLVGFLGGIYLPIGTLAGAIQSAMKCTPVMYGAAMFRSVFVQEILAQTFYGAPKELVSEYRVEMGIDLSVLSHELTAREEALILLACGIVFFATGVGILRLRRNSDR